MKRQLEDYGLNFNPIPIFCDNTSAINLTRNLIQHFKANHIEIRHYFIRDHVQKGDIDLNFISIVCQLVDIFTKALHQDRFFSIKKEKGILELD